MAATTDWTDCHGAPGAATDGRLNACTRIISSGHETADRLAGALAARCEIFETRGRIKDARRDCDRAIALAPKNAQGYSQRSSVYAVEGNYDHAVADLAKAISLETRPETDFLMQSVLYNEKAEYDRLFPGQAGLRASDYEHAIENATMMLQFKAEPKDQNAAMALGILKQWASDQIRKARDGQDRLRNGEKFEDPKAWCEGGNPPVEGPPWDRVDMGCTALINSRHHASVDIGHAYFLRAESRRSAATYNSAPGYVPEQAIFDYQAAVALKSDVAGAHAGLGAIYLAEQDYDRALSELNAAVSLKGPILSSALASRAAAYVGKGQFARAISDFDAALNLKPDETGTLIGRAGAYDRSGDYTRALVDCKLAASLSKGTFLQQYEGFDTYLSHTVCGNVYFHQGDFGNAVASYDQAINFMPSVTAPEALYGRGLAKLRLGSQAEGQADLDLAEKQQPDIATKEAKIGIKP